MTDKEKVLNIVSDLVLDFVVYDRKNDEDLSSDDLENFIKTGVVTEEEIVDMFRKTLKNIYM